jgi:hypothetical protein
LHGGIFGGKFSDFRIMRAGRIAGGIRRLIHLHSAQLIAICHRCPFSAKGCAGPCPCTIDGRDIIDHANAGNCPEDFYNHPPEIDIPDPPEPAPLPAPHPHPWPWAIRVAAKVFRDESDRGFGDTAQRMIAKLGGEHVKRILADAGIECGCRERQEWLNARFPYR